MSSRENLLDAIQKYLEGGVAKHKANVEVYLNQSVGIGEHSDIIDNHNLLTNTLLHKVNTS